MGDDGAVAAKRAFDDFEYLGLAFRHLECVDQPLLVLRPFDGVLELTFEGGHRLVAATAHLAGEVQDHDQHRGERAAARTAAVSRCCAAPEATSDAR